MAPTDQNPDEFLTVAEVASTLKLNQQTVRNWIDQGSLPAFRVGRRVRIRRSDFQRILDESYSGSTSPASAGGGPSADDFWGGQPVGVAESERGASIAAPGGRVSIPTDGEAAAPDSRLE